MKKQLLPLCLILISILLLALGGGFVYLLAYGGTLPFSFGGKAAPVIQTDEDLRVIVLDEFWMNANFASESQEEQTLAIDTAVTMAKAMGGNAIALTARLSDGSALFRDGTETIPTASTVTVNDQLFKKFDPFSALIQAASAENIEILLYPTSEGNSPLTASEAATPPAFLTALLEEYQLRLFAPTGEQISPAAASEGAATPPSATTYYTVWNADAHTTLLRNDASAVTLSYDLSKTGETAFVLGDYSLLHTDGLALISAYTTGLTLPDLAPYLGNKTYARTLSVTYPVEDGSDVSYSDLFLMGTSDPTQPLTLNDTEVPRHGEQGVWGILVSLEYGANTFHLVNGAETMDYTVNLKSWTGGGSGSSYGDGALTAMEQGQRIQIVTDIASALSNPYSSGSIKDTLYKGAVAEVTHSISRGKYDDTTYAYLLTTGDYVRAANCILLPPADTTLQPTASIFNEETNATVLTIAGGTPAVYHTWDGNVLSLTLLSADCATTASATDWFTVSSSTQDGNTNFLFSFTDAEPLYGWAVNYDTEQNLTRLILKKTPRLATDPRLEPGQEGFTLPLTGVRVMLDAGHGLTDTGAMGSGGQNAPSEKDANLALVMATKYRLEQLGATVLTTRVDDSFPTLDDRVGALNNQHPDYFISVHHNSLELVTDLNTATGTEAYWFYDEGDALANRLVDHVSSVTGRKRRSVNYGYYYVTRSNICPATLLEIGFMTNPSEYEDVVDVDTIWKEAGAIAQSVYDCVKANGKQ